MVWCEGVDVAEERVRRRLVTEGGRALWRDYKSVTGGANSIGLWAEHGA